MIQDKSCGATGAETTLELGFAVGFRCTFATVVASCLAWLLPTLHHFRHPVLGLVADPKLVIDMLELALAT